MLKCIKYFRQGLWEFGVGDVVEQHPAIESWLLDSFPAHFVPAYAPDAAFVQVAEAQPEAQPVEVVAADVEAPPADKAIKRARGRK
jgi:hypothetical protein